MKKPEKTLGGAKVPTIFSFENQDSIQIPFSDFLLCICRICTCEYPTRTYILKENLEGATQGATMSKVVSVGKVLWFLKTT